jgi:hypothetical protein
MRQLSQGDKTMNDKKLTAYEGINPKHYASKVRIANSISGLRNDLLFTMFHGAKIIKRSTAGELAMLRADWLHWLGKTPYCAFLSHHDAFWHYVKDCDDGTWNRCAWLDSTAMVRLKQGSKA